MVMLSQRSAYPIYLTDWETDGFVGIRTRGADPSRPNQPDGARAPNGASSSIQFSSRRYAICATALFAASLASQAK